MFPDVPLVVQQAVLLQRVMTSLLFVSEAQQHLKNIKGMKEEFLRKSRKELMKMNGVSKEEYKRG
jgi:hypothetical protein